MSLLALPLEPYQLIQLFVHGYLDEAGTKVRLWRIQLKTAVGLPEDAGHLSVAIDDMMLLRQALRDIDNLVRYLDPYDRHGPVHANIQELLNRDLQNAVKNLDSPPVEYITATLGSCLEGGLMRLFSTIPMWE